MSKKIFKKTYSLLLVLTMIVSLFAGVKPLTINAYADNLPYTQSPPSITTSNNNDYYTPGSPAIAVDSNITLVSSAISETDVSITNNFDSLDALSFTNDGNEGNITATYSSGQLTLKSDGNTATPSQWQAALRAVTYSSKSNSSSPRTINFKVTDTTGTTCENNKTININPLSINTSPLNPYYSHSGDVISFFSNSSISNLPDGQNISSITFTLSGMKDNGYEQLYLTYDYSHDCTYRSVSSSNPSTIVIYFAGHFTAADIAALVNSWQYTDSATNPTSGTRTMTVNSITSSGGVTANLNIESNITVGPQKAQTISFAAPGDQNFGTSPTFTATSTSGLPVTFTSENPDIATITSSGTLTFLKTGSVTIDANQAGSKEYLAAPTVSQTFTVNAVAPGVPTNVSAVADNSQASISFNTPNFDGGSAITDYTVTATPSSGSPIIAHGTTSPITVTGLNNGTKYDFTVAATNAAGTGAVSTSASATPSAPTPPPMPQTIAFAAPGDQNFGTSPTLAATATSGLLVSFTSENPDIATITPNGTLTFLKTGSVTIDANQTGNSNYCAAPTVSRTFTVNAVAPGVPTNVSAVAGNSQASINFNTPNFDGGSAITDYTVTATPSSGSPIIAHGTTSPITVTGLNNGTKYDFTVAATNAAGTGAASTSASATPSAPVPPTTPITGTSVDSQTGKPLKPIPAIVTDNYDGTKAVSFKSQDAICLDQADNTINTISDISKLGFNAPAVTGTSSPGAAISIAADGTISVSGLLNGSEAKFSITYDLGNGKKITIGYIDVSVSSTGTVSLTSCLVDPYGTITDAATGSPITGANVTLYYANTARNIANGKTPNTVVSLPAIDGFEPNNNANPQVSDALGQYGFMVYPTADYYIVATKDGYDKYTSPTISVEQTLVKWDFQMNKSSTNNVGVEYQSHIQNIAWQNPVENGAEAGTTGQCLRLEALKINLINAPKTAHILYQAHIQNKGWQSAVEDGAEAGTTGQGLRLEAIKLSLENMPDYSIQYRVHVQNIGWMDWVSDGQVAGTTGRALRAEAIEIRIVKTSN